MPLRYGSTKYPRVRPDGTKQSEGFAFPLDVRGFEASSGWLTRFRDRHGIAWKTICGESKDADHEAARTWRDDKLRDIINGYSPDDIYNADETGVFYHTLPNKTMAFKNDSSKGGKQSKVRITALLFCNATDSHKLKPQVIGKYAKPRCFKGVPSLPCIYKSNKNALMTRNIFSEWLLSINEEMWKAQRKILLIVHNCSAHLVDVHLSNVRIEYLPPNCAAVLQPLNLGIIQNLKVEYRRRLVQRILIDIRIGKNDPINVRQAAEMLTGSWWSVTPATIRNCWHKSGPFPLCSESVQDEQYEEAVESGMRTEFCHQLDVDSSTSFEDYVLCDSELVTCAKLSDLEIVSSISPEEDECDDEYPTAEITVAAEADSNPVTLTEAVGYILKLRDFVFQQQALPEEVHKSIDSLGSFVASCALRAPVQMKITDFFSK
ncbi:hypothetical protein HPB48_006927 [Haemaphysalis longicornis]|uniref:DDE-1 domain-containing protein n=1 Tax=Haemaphysalis longicornis TaxID=44386 RepID=A0A9J6GJG8_HAELO|nr:hypothetical protein HPB48_006927 [Haemaphysalis longicornis]